MKINVSVRLGLQGCEINDTLDLDDLFTEREIQAVVREWALEQVEWSHERAEPEEDPR